MQKAVYLILSGFIIFSFNIKGQVMEKFGAQDYSKEWKIIDSLIEKEGLYRTAEEKIDLLYKKAVKDNNPGQIVKILQRKSKLLKTYEYSFEAYLKTIQNLDSIIQISTFPAKNILNSICADAYHSYFKSNYYNILARTEITEGNSNDIATWDAFTLTKAIIKKHMNALEDKEKLMRVPIETIKEALDFAEEDKIIRPTLYDFLAFKALDYFSTEEWNLPISTEIFKLNKAEYFSSVDEFIGINIELKDSLTPKYYALKLFQDLLAFHLRDNDPSALIDADLKRLTFLYIHSSVDKKNELYTSALTAIAEKYKKHHMSGEALVKKAEFYYNVSGKYNPLISEKYKWLAKDALQICEEVINKFPKSYGEKQARALKYSILRKEFSVDYEKQPLPNENIKLKASYKNLNKVFIRTSKVELDELMELEFSLNRISDQNKKIDAQINFGKSKEAIEEIIVELPDDGDYQKHSIEIKLEGKEPGYYYVLIGTGADFDYKKNVVVFGVFNVTNLALLNKLDENGSTEFIVLNRKTGEPIVNASVKFINYYNKWDKKRWIDIKKETQLEVKTDKEGKFLYKKRDNVNEYYYIDIDFKNDRINTAFLDTYVGFWESYKYEKSKRLTAYYFTDRAIYRPGQTIYFKGVLLEEEGEGERQIKANKDIEVKFFDVNGQEISALQLKSNEFGSFNGEFIAPVGRLNGQMSISGYGVKYIRVEDYKRPKFFVSFNPIEGEYKIGDYVTIKGNASSYSGAKISGASVKYRTVRTARFPYWRFIAPISPRMELINGETTTDENGDFLVTFKAIGDDNVDMSFYPIFNFQVIADVVDISGETRSSTAYVYAGYQSLFLSVLLPSMIDRRNEFQYQIDATNINGAHIAARIKASINKLKSPNRIFRERLWNRPDKQLFSPKEYYDYFPSDLYADENEFHNWEIDSIMYKNEFIESEKAYLEIQNISAWDEGVYSVELESIDKYGNVIKNINYFTLFDSKNNTLPTPTPLFIQFPDREFQPGDTAKIIFGSSYNITAYYEIINISGSKKRETIKINNGKKIIEIPIDENDRGNAHFNIFYVVDNRFYSEDCLFYVPYNNKKLEFEFETFRDKLAPGMEEEWKIKIKGQNKDRLLAEMVAALYDQSLDEFAKNNWNFINFPFLYNQTSWRPITSFGSQKFAQYNIAWNESFFFIPRKYSKFKYNDAFDYYYSYYMKSMDVDRSVGGRVSEGTPPPPMMKNGDLKKEREESSESLTDNILTEKSISVEKDFEQIAVRTNLNETAFFFPKLMTNDKGEVIISFKIPEALTRWKMLGFAHTKDLSFGFTDKTLVTQKELMVVPNLPRFFREDDEITISSKITNLTEKDVNGSAQLLLFDAFTMKEVNFSFLKDNAIINFEAKSGQSAAVSWRLKIPFGYQAIVCRISAKAGNNSDGEENIIPILTNRLLVTETLPLWTKGGQTKRFKMEKLLNIDSPTLQHKSATLEFTSNPVWSAIHALPYLMEFPYECCEQIFSRFYANSLAMNIANSDPKIRKVFEKWKNYQPEAFESKLEKNQELKYLLLEETPWVRQSQNEAERKRRIGVLFDIDRLSLELNLALTKLLELQMPSGGWPWFNGMKENRYITQHISAGFGKLLWLNIVNPDSKKDLFKSLRKATQFADRSINEDYQNLLNRKIDIEKLNINYIQLHYLYMRSFLKDIPITDDCNEAYDYYYMQAVKYWNSFTDIYSLGMIALVSHRKGDEETATRIIKSLRERATYSEEFGMFWKTSWGYNWYEVPIETQSLMIETFSEVANDQDAVDEMKVWLLKQKQTQDWKTTKATVEACYALTLSGSNLLSDDRMAVITIGEEIIDPNIDQSVKTEEGTCYLKKVWNEEEISNNMADIVVEQKSKSPGWGAFYWQYFENLDKITSNETPLKIMKKLFLEEMSDKGPIIIPIDHNTLLKPGDLIKVRIEIRVDRAMDYVHMKDMRASGLEPINVISACKYKDGLFYYESTRDAATNFFFDRLLIGTYVFEYPLRVNLNGDFSNGITTIQSMYAPEFSSHSEGIRIIIGEK